MFPRQPSEQVCLFYLDNILYFHVANLCFILDSLVFHSTNHTSINPGTPEEIFRAEWPATMKVKTVIKIHPDNTRECQLNTNEHQG